MPGSFRPAATYPFETRRPAPVAAGCARPDLSDSLKQETAMPGRRIGTAVLFLHPGQGGGEARSVRAPAGGRVSGPATPGRRMGAAVSFTPGPGRRRGPWCFSPGRVRVLMAATSGRRKMPPRRTDPPGRRRGGLIPICPAVLSGVQIHRPDPRGTRLCSADVAVDRCSGFAFRNVLGPGQRQLPNA